MARTKKKKKCPRFLEKRRKDGKYTSIHYSSVARKKPNAPRPWSAEEKTEYPLERREGERTARSMFESSTVPGPATRSRKAERRGEKGESRVSSRQGGKAGERRPATVYIQCTSRDGRAGLLTTSDAKPTEGK